MFHATLSIICKCGILGKGCMSIWCASGRGFLFQASLDHRYVRTHAYRRASARTPYYYGTQTKTKVDVL